MNKYFDGSHEWTEEDINTTGLPRPFKKFDKKYYKKLYSKVKLAKKIPIPWQSKPVFNNLDDVVVFNVIIDNEKRVIEESLCGYCGIKIRNNEYCVRWNPEDISYLNDIDDITFANDGHSPIDRVSSDYYPLHIECMKQARIFCPFMKNVLEKNFEYGSFDILKNNSINLTSKIINILERK